MHHRKLCDILKHQNLLYVSSATNVAIATKQMVERNVAAILIIDDGKLKGIFTERDALRRIIVDQRNPAVTLIGDVMTTKIVSLTGDRIGFEAVRLMDEMHVRHIVVTELPGIGYGIASMRDFAHTELATFEKEIDFEKHVWDAI